MVYIDTSVCLSVCSEALPFFLLLIDLSKASALAKIAFKSRSKVCVWGCDGPCCTVH